MIPISRPIIGDAEKSAVAEVLASGMLAAGPKVVEFEEAFAAFSDAATGVAVGSGTAALHVGLLAAGVGRGDEVVVPSFTFAASANAVAMVGATPVFCDVDPTTYCITPELVEPHVTKQTRAVMAVHLYGHPAPLDGLFELCRAHDLDLIEDAAQAHGASWRGQTAGSVGRFAAFSFYPTKNMTTGEGGMITTGDAELAQRARWIRNQGMGERYYHEVVGINERMTSIEAAIGLAQLQQLPGWTEQRQANAARYDRELSEALGRPAPPSDGTHVYHQYTLRPPDRDRVIEALEDAGIGHGIYYPLGTHRQKPYSGTASVLPTTDAITESVLSIPIRPDLTEDEQTHIIDTLNGVSW